MAFSSQPDAIRYVLVASYWRSPPEQMPASLKGHVSTDVWEKTYNLGAEFHSTIFKLHVGRFIGFLVGVVGILLAVFVNPLLGLLLIPSIGVAFGGSYLRREVSAQLTEDMEALSKESYGGFLIPGLYHNPRDKLIRTTGIWVVDVKEWSHFKNRYLNQPSGHQPFFAMLKDEFLESDDQVKL